MKQGAANLFFGLALFSFGFIATPGVMAGELPAAVVQSYYAALTKAQSPQELDKFLSKRNLSLRQETIKDVPAARLAKFMQFLRVGLPMSIKTTAEKIDGDKATVMVQASDGRPMLAMPKKPGDDATVILQKFGIFFLVNQNKEWKIDAEEWDSRKDLAGTVNPNDWKVWLNEVGATPIPQESVKGKLDGIPFVPSEVSIGKDPFFGGTWLRFKQGSDSTMSIGLLDEVADVQGRSFDILNEKLSWPRHSMFNVIMETPSTPTGARTMAGAAICAMKLKFGQTTKDGIPGQILIRMSCQPEVSLVGTFIAKERSTPGTAGGANPVSSTKSNPVETVSHQGTGAALAKDFILKYLIMDTAVFAVPGGQTVRLTVGESYKGVKLEAIDAGTARLKEGDAIVNKRLF